MLVFGVLSRCLLVGFGVGFLEFDFEPFGFEGFGLEPLALPPVGLALVWIGITD